jgi:hypothetical protein
MNELNSTIENRKSKISLLPLKLGIFVVLLFALVTAACLLYTPLRVRYYTAKLKSDDPDERVAGVDGLLGMGEKGVEILAHNLGGGRWEAEFLADNWKHRGRTIPGDMDKRFPLHIASLGGYEDAVTFLIAKGADVNPKDDCGDTPLLAAARNGHEDIIRILLENNANPNIQDNQDDTPLHQAAHEEYENIVKLLIEKGANVNVKDIEDLTPLHCAAMGSNKNVLTMLLKEGADVNAKANKGWTPLHVAADLGNEGIAKLLIQKGALVNERLLNTLVVDCSSGKNEIVLGKTPLDLAKAACHEETAKAIRACGGKTGEELKAEGK